MRCYLAGPIAGLTYEGCTDWRTWVERELAQVGIVAMSPMRHTEYLQAQLPPGTLLHGGDGDHPRSTDRAISTQCRYDVKTCDMVLAYLCGTERISIGTVMEIAWAQAYDKPLVLVIEHPGSILITPETHVTDDFGRYRSNSHEHPILTDAAGWRVDNLEDGVEIVKAVLLPGQPLMTLRYEFDVAEREKEVLEKIQQDLARTPGQIFGGGR